jgi:hypothetical protein
VGDKCEVNLSGSLGYMYCAGVDLAGVQWRVCVRSVGRSIGGQAETVGVGLRIGSVGSTAAHAQRHEAPSTSTHTHRHTCTKTHTHTHTHTHQ